MKTTLLIIMLLLLSINLIGQSNKAYLEKVLNRLNEIETAAYFYTTSASAPGDTLTFTMPQHLYVKAYVNRSDTSAGASYAIYKQEDTTRIQNFYNGFVEGRFNWDEKTVRIDSFQNYPYPFRVLYFPFHTRTESIINYALTTEDSTRIDLHDFGDSVRFSLYIYDKIVEFVIRPIDDVHPYESTIGKVSQYDIWINKSDNLPYRMRRKMPHNTSFEACSDVKLNVLHKNIFNTADYFPSDFSAIPLTRQRRKFKSDLEGQVAADWTLKDINNNTVGLADLNSKVLMIQFTGVGCGPCHESIPFLKQLVNEYKHKDFEFIAIETWSKNIEGLVRYQRLNDLNFKFLKADKNVTRNYQIMSVPVFFLLDETRSIKKVIFGYSKEVTDKEILKHINELL